MVAFRAGLTEQDVDDAIKQRADARKAKDYAGADAVRAQLSAKGIAIMDSADGVAWRPTIASSVHPS